MNDQGEKIIFLARELLNQSAAEPRPAARTHTLTMSFRALCLTALISAGVGSAATAIMHENDRPLNRYEKTEIDALVFYAAKLKGIDEENIRREVAAKMGLVRFDDMSASDFSAARRYLQEKAL